jgi:hypothetical protein
MVDQVVRENPRRFFLSSGHRVVTATHRSRTDGSLLGAAFDAMTVENVIAGARDVRARVATIRPGRPGLRVEDAVREIAARTGLDVPLLRPAASARDRLTGQVALCVAGGALCVSVCAAAIAPALRATLELPRIRAQAGLLAPVSREIANLARARGQAESILALASRREGERRAMIRLLADLSRLAPESTAVLSLRVDSLEGSLVVLAPRVAELLPALDAAREIRGLRIAGAVTKERMSDVQLERAAFRFGRAGTPSRKPPRPRT